MTRLIANDYELQIVFRVLLEELKKNVQEGKFVIFPPDKIILPEEILEEENKEGKIIHPKEKTEEILTQIASAGIKILHHEEVSQIYKIDLPQNIQIRYNEATIQELIKENQNGEDWRLCYYSGHNLRQLREKIGTDKNNQPYFYNNDWWLKDEENEWNNKSLEKGYYLLNFKGKLADKNWSKQEKLIEEKYPHCKRAHEFVVGESVISNFNINNQERLLENWYHWGKESDSDGDRVGVGDFDSDGFLVSSGSPGVSGGFLRVVLLRKFDF